MEPVCRERFLVEIRNLPWCSWVSHDYRPPIKFASICSTCVSVYPHNYEISVIDCDRFRIGLRYFSNSQRRNHWNQKKILQEHYKNIVPHYLAKRTIPTGNKIPPMMQLSVTWLPSTNQIAASVMPLPRTPDTFERLNIMEVQSWGTSGHIEHKLGQFSVWRQSALFAVETCR